MSRRPLPTAVKKLQGKPGGRPLNENEPIPDPGMPEPPAGLSTLAREHWELVAPQLHKMGVLTLVDQTALHMYVELFATWKQAVDNINEYGPVVKQNGRVSQSPYMLVALNAQKEMRQLLTEFGMTPSSRSSIKVPGSEGKRKGEPKFRSVS